MTLDDMSLFVAVARAGNFSRAGARIRVPTATLSRRITALERGLGVRLFERTTRTVTLTPVGQRLLERCGPLVDEALLIRSDIQAASTQVSGHARVSMPVDFGVHLLGEWLPDFARKYPGITLDLDLSPRRVDLFTEPVDVVFRPDTAGLGGAVARRLGGIPRGLYAAPNYLDRHGRPRRPADLASHPCLCLGRAKVASTWTLERNGTPHPVKVSGPLGMNNMGLVRTLAEREMGIGLLSDFVALGSVTSGRLERVLPEYSLPDWDLYAVTTSRFIPAPVRAVIDFVEQRLEP